MVKVTGPLFSQSASGTLAGAIVFGSWKGRATVRSHAVPANPDTPAQKAQRAMQSFVSKNWAALSAAEKASWDSAAASKAISPFNEYTSYNMKRWTQFEWPVVDKTQAAGTIATLGALTLTAGTGQFSLSQDITVVNDNWGLAVAVSTSTGFTPAKTDVCLIKTGLVSPVEGVITKLAANTYYVRTLGFTNGGSPTAWLTQSSVVVA